MKLLYINSGKVFVTYLILFFHNNQHGGLFVCLYFSQYGLPVFLQKNLAYHWTDLILTYSEAIFGTLKAFY